MYKRHYYSSTQVVVLCIFCFFVGRFMQLPGMPSTGRGPVVRSERKLLVDPQQEPQQQDLLAKADPTTTTTTQQPLQKIETFEDAIKASGLLNSKPAVPTGTSGTPDYIVQPFQVLSWYPTAFLFPAFMDRQKCDHVIDMASKRLVPSGLALKQGDTAEGTVNIRTSQGTFMTREMDPSGVLQWIEEKIAMLTMVPAGHGEAFNILRYDSGQHYDSHYDAFDEASYGKQMSNRIATVLVYLEDVEQGGETVFLLEGQGGLKRLEGIDYKGCDTGIKYKPRAGDALLFWSSHINGTFDKHSLHGGCPVIKGTKWAMTKWIRDQCHYGDGCNG